MTLGYESIMGKTALFHDTEQLWRDLKFQTFTFE